MHLSEYDIASLLDRTLTSAKRKEITSHLSACKECAEDVGAASRLLQTLEDKTVPNLDEKTRTASENLHEIRQGLPRQGRFDGFPIRYAVAATIILGLGIAGYLKFHQDEPQQFRGSERAPTLNIVSPIDAATINSLRPEFQWSQVAGASFYRLYVYSEDGTTQWKFDAPSTAYTPTLDLRMQSGTRYLWKAEAIFADGARVVSDVHAFTYSP